MIKEDKAGTGWVNGSSVMEAQDNADHLQSDTDVEKEREACH